MNAIEILNRINFYNDVTRNARFSFNEINLAVNDVIQNYIDQKIGENAQKSIESFQSTQRIRDDLRTLIKSQALVPTTTQTLSNKYYTYTEMHIVPPSDYYDLIGINYNIDGLVVYARPTTYNEIPIVLRDSFKHPTNEKVYYLEDSTGYKIYKGVGGTVTNPIFEYIRFADTFNVGKESDLIDPTGVLVVSGVYIAVEPSVHAGNSYAIGSVFTASSAVLTSGQVILQSNTTTIDLPEKTHEDISKMAAENLSGIITDYNKSAFIEKALSKGD